MVSRPGVTNVLNGQQFQPFQGLLNGLNLQPTVTDRSAIMTAAGDVATESIFRHFMGSTNASSDAEDNILPGFSTVSVDPGWRTKKGWVAEAIMTAEIEYVPARDVVLKRVFDTYTNPVFRAQMYLSYGSLILSNDDSALALATNYLSRTNEQLSIEDFARSFVVTNKDIEITNSVTNLVWHWQSVQPEAMIMEPPSPLVTEPPVASVGGHHHRRMSNQPPPPPNLRWETSSRQPPTFRRRLTSAPQP